MVRRNLPSAGILPIWKRTAEAGGPLPSVEALAEQLGVSRVAVREALIEMEADGLVRRHQGAGTFANPAALEMPVRLDRQMDFTDRLEAVGFRSRVEVVEAEILCLGSIIGPTRLDLPDDARVLRTVKRWWADDIVAVVAVDVVPLGRRSIDSDVMAHVTDSMIEISATLGIARADWMCTWPTAVEVDESTAALLDLEPGRAVLRTEQLGIERLGGTVFHAVEHHRPDLVENGLIRTIYS